ncbi:hypothetical protein ABL78_6963 [Leptomonas seymouri]|uniref:Uncharacterized protein n=1 Tax=Leptomonas seymouri TaxID=5684 RepID=A0A0N1I1A4_LEPSE|nr:hypothetical protein ABL78_6963 [Leptomonas seymouri]|eukprot:KPI83988.1 hypothetical protein ABL78_6963 [Leptomonas seymouri]
MSSPDNIRSRQAEMFVELRPVAQGLEEALRVALNSWKEFITALEHAAQLYDQYASFIPTTRNADRVGLDASVGVTADAVKLCKTFKKTASMWSLSDEVVELRAQLFTEWTLWRRTGRRLSKIADITAARKQEMHKVKKMRKSVAALERAKSEADGRHLVKTLESQITSTEASIKKHDAAIAEEFKTMLKKSLLRDHSGAAKTGHALSNVGRGLVNAFHSFNEDASVLPVTPVVARTPAMGIPLQINVQAGQRSQPATQTRTEAEYGGGFPYASTGWPLDENSLEERRVSLSA